MKLSGSHVLVTGGASGLGEAVVRRCVSDGAVVTIFDLSEEAGAKLVSEFGADKVLCMKVNIIDETSVKSSIETCIAKFGPLRAVVQCAGIASPCRVISSRGVVHPLDAFNKVVQVNLIGTFNVLRLAVAAMSTNDPIKDERGVIINVASVAAFEGQIGQAAYSASKGAVVSMTLPLARELGQLGIRCNCIAPGIFATPMMAKLPEKAKASLSKQVPFPQRLGEPAEFADCAANLITNQYYNGMCVRLDGSIRMSAL